MPDTIVPFTGITTLDLDPDQLLDRAKGELEDAIIIGFATDGSFYFASSLADAGEAIFRLERAKHLLMRKIDELEGTL